MMGGKDHGRIEKFTQHFGRNSEGRMREWEDDIELDLGKNMM
jgi:hypothetical protein